jgi:hypothetical protein
MIHPGPERWISLTDSVNMLQERVIAEPIELQPSVWSPFSTFSKSQEALQLHWHQKTRLGQVRKEVEWTGQCRGQVDLYPEL